MTEERICSSSLLVHPDQIKLLTPDNKRAPLLPSNFFSGASPVSAVTYHSPRFATLWNEQSTKHFISENSQKGKISSARSLYEEYTLAAEWKLSTYRSRHFWLLDKARSTFMSPHREEFLIVNKFLMIYSSTRSETPISCENIDFFSCLVFLLINSIRTSIF
jgi:hypothetical protein